MDTKSEMVLWIHAKSMKHLGTWGESFVVYSSNCDTNPDTIFSFSVRCESSQFSTQINLRSGYYLQSYVMRLVCSGTGFESVKIRSLVWSQYSDYPASQIPNKIANVAIKFSHCVCAAPVRRSPWKGITTWTHFGNTYCP